MKNKIKFEQQNNDEDDLSFVMMVVVVMTFNRMASSCSLKCTVATN